MYQKAYQKQFTESKFQKCDFSSCTQSSVIFTTIREQTSCGEQQTRYKYSSYIAEQDEITRLEDLRIYDSTGEPTAGNELLDVLDSRCLPTFICNNFEATIDKFTKKGKQYFASSIVNLVNDTPHLAKIMTNQSIVKINGQKDKLYLEDFKWNPSNYDVFGILPKSKSNFVIKKKYCKTLLDLHLLSNGNQQIQNVSVLNEQNVLLHIGRHTEMQQKNFLISKFDIADELMSWKVEIGHFQTFFNKNIQISHNTFLNGVYDFQDHTSTLKIYDYRTKGEVLSVLKSTDLQVVRVGRNHIPDFQYLQRFQDFKLLSLLTSKGGLINIPFLMDLRSPHQLQMIKAKREDEKICFVKQIQYKKPYLFTIQREYRQYSFKNAKICRYNLFDL